MFENTIKLAKGAIFNTLIVPGIKDDGDKFKVICKKSDLEKTVVKHMIAKITTIALVAFGIINLFTSISFGIAIFPLSISLFVSAQYVKKEYKKEVSIAFWTSLVLGVIASIGALTGTIGLFAVAIITNEFLNKFSNAIEQQFKALEDGIKANNVKGAVIKLQKGLLFYNPQVRYSLGAYFKTQFN